MDRIYEIVIAGTDLSMKFGLWAILALGLVLIVIGGAKIIMSWNRSDSLYVSQSDVISEEEYLDLMALDRGLNEDLAEPTVQLSLVKE